MAIGRDVIEQLRHLLRPIATSVRNMAARAVVELVNDGTKLQLVQLGVLDGETVDDGEHCQPYGLTAVPLPGAEAVVIFPGGDRSHPLVVSVSDRANRPTGGESGDVTLYSPVSQTSARVILLASGDIEIHPAPGHEVLIRDEGGSIDRLVKKSEHDGHTHAPGTFVAPGGGGPVTGVSGGAAPVAGTQRLRVQ